MRKQHERATWFHRFARATSRAVGRPLAFFIALVSVVVWALLGPIFGFSDTWQLVINTATTIATFLMVFLIQHTQNHDAEATALKLAELIRATKGAKNAYAALDEYSEAELEELYGEYMELARRARDQQEKLKN